MKLWTDCSTEGAAIFIFDATLSCIFHKYKYAESWWRLPLKRRQLIFSIFLLFFTRHSLLSRILPSFCLLKCRLSCFNIKQPLSILRALCDIWFILRGKQLRDGSVEGLVPIRKKQPMDDKSSHVYKPYISTCAYYSLPFMGQPLKLDSVRFKALDLISLKCQRFYPESTNQTACTTNHRKLQTTNCKLQTANFQRAPKRWSKRGAAKNKKKGWGQKCYPNRFSHKFANAQLSRLGEDPLELPLRNVWCANKDVNLSFAGLKLG